jgi:hypothetical protein
MNAVRQVPIRVVSVTKGNSAACEAFAGVGYSLILYYTDVSPVLVLVCPCLDQNSGTASHATGELSIKINRYAKFSEEFVKPNPTRAKSAAVAVKAEGERVLKSVLPQVFQFQKEFFSYDRHSPKPCCIETCGCASPTVYLQRLPNTSFDPFHQEKVAFPGAVHSVR